MRKIYYLLFAAWFTIAGYAQQDKIEQLNAYFDLLEKHQQDIGAIAIDKEGERLYERKFGYASLPEGVRNCENLQNRIGSITKMFTGVMFFQLQERGEIDLTETLDTYFPDVPNAEKITINHLLSHTSGLVDMTARDSDLTWLLQPVTEKEIVDEIIRQGILFEPGEDVRYSNSGYYLLGKILEQKYGKPYEEILQQQILKPVGAKHTSSNVVKDLCIAPSYRFAYNAKKWEEVEDFYFPNVVAVGDIASTPEDMLAMMKGIWSHELITAASLEAMIPEAGQRFGKGMAMVPFYEKLFYGHSGGTFGSYALLIHHPEDQLTLAITVNGMEYPMNDVVIGVLSILYDQPYEWPVFSEGSDTIFDSDYSLYEGLYAAADLPIQISVFQQDGELYVQVIGQPSFSLDQVGERTFEKKMLKLEIEFPEEGKMKLKQAGVELLLEKTESTN